MNCKMARLKFGSGCDSVGRAVVSNFSHPRFKPKHCQYFILNIFTVRCWKDENEEKRPWLAHLKMNATTCNQKFSFFVSDGRRLATNCEVKFIETSAGIQHNVDELLVGILKQMRLRQERRESGGVGKNTGSRNSRDQYYKTLFCCGWCRQELSRS